MRLPDLPDLVLTGTPSLFGAQKTIAPASIQEPDTQHNLDVLIASQEHYGGVGIAAPQIGWGVRVMSFGINKPNPRYAAAGVHPIECWINPEIIWNSDQTCWAWEGCLSVPGFRGWIERPEKITLRGLNRKGEHLEKELDGFMARVIQHEMDHLDGILFPQRVSNPEWMVPLPCFEQQESWDDNWPTPGANKTRPGEVSPLP